MSMKLVLFAISLAQLSLPAAWGRGGDSIGSGGILWICSSEPPDPILYAAVLADLFEAREQHHWPLIADPGGDPIMLYQQRKEWLSHQLPDLFRNLESYFNYVESHRTLVKGQLLPTGDLMGALKPPVSSCPAKVEWQPRNIANFREEDQQIMIDEFLWNSPALPTLDKAALLFHEAIYYWMRNTYGSTDSVKSRKVTGLLFSTLSPEQIKEKLALFLGSYPEKPVGKFMCVMKNSLTNQAYVAYEDSLDDAEFTVQERCQNEEEPGRPGCSSASVVCDEVNDGRLIKCNAEHSTSRKLYRSQGRNELEGKFRAHLACFLGSQAIKVSPQDCPAFAFIRCR